MKKIILIGFIFVLLILITGCAPKSTDLEEKTLSGDKTPSPPAEKTEIKVSQMGLEMIISPSQGKVVKDMVTITVTKVPANTWAVALAIQGPGIESMEKTGPN